MNKTDRGTTHKLLERQLRKCHLTVDETPTDLTSWQCFIDKINHSYLASDQDRYLLERAMEISSNELIALNKEMSTVQNLAKIGYWYYEADINYNSLSREIYVMLDIPIDTKIIGIDLIANLIHEPEKNRFMEYLRKLTTQGEGFSLETRLSSYSDPSKTSWFSIEGYKTNQSDKSNKVVLILIDINSRKQADIMIESLNKQLVMSARRAGMADVATSILHNMGNVLNSANVSISVLTDQLTGLSNKKIDEIEAIIHKESLTITNFIKSNDKADTFMEYLLSLNKALVDSCRQMLSETKQLRDHIDHLIEITSMQKLIGNATEMKENIFVPELIEHALKMSKPAFKNNGNIPIKLNMTDNPFIFSDRSKILQILINLICNAYESLLDTHQDNKHIEIDLHQSNNDSIVISVKDNGIGIPCENLIKIFTFGFTTKKSGHGFGLHSCAIAAKELGGELNAYSNGPNMGAKFALTLPVGKILEEV